jgi:transposase-like protein
MLPSCPYCILIPFDLSACPIIIRYGYYYRTSDSRLIQRFRCLGCKKCFSKSTVEPCFRQLKRQKNEPLRRLFSSGVSLRRAARLLHITRSTVVRKLKFLGDDARFLLEAHNLEKPKAEVVEFDDMETFEHTKCKPLSITLAVESKTRRILGIEVSQMPAKGRLAKKSFKKYGPRRDFRSQGRAKLFERIRPLISEDALIKSDSNPHYPNDVKKWFPLATHEMHLGQRGSVTGQGELKKIRFDPLFSLNHTCAKLRDDIKRLARKTWCTTKDPRRLADHLAIYALYHNQNL